jgi:2-polyprenyl-3-methyl-5-hydroxy-6-metoxy-1,4-benzoquinol methylase
MTFAPFLLEWVFMWNQRYNQPDYVYGTQPNDFLVSASANIPRGKLLSLGEGEGRNAAYLATQGWDVTAVDSSEVGLEKARRLAAEKGVQITTIVADLVDFKSNPTVGRRLSQFFAMSHPRFAFPFIVRLCVD